MFGILCSTRMNAARTSKVNDMTRACVRDYGNTKVQFGTASQRSSKMQCGLVEESEMLQDERPTHMT